MNCDFLLVSDVLKQVFNLIFYYKNV